MEPTQSYERVSDIECVCNEEVKSAESENNLDAGWAVEKVVDHRMKHETKQYLVKWSEYFPFENTWEDMDAVEGHAPENVRDYEAILRKRQGHGNADMFDNITKAFWYAAKVASNLY